MKEQVGAVDPARRDHQAARPRKLATDEEDADDPTYVAENGFDTITKSQYADMQRPDKQGSLNESNSLLEIDVKVEAGKHDSDSNRERPKEATVATIGGVGKKRRAKAIGGDDADDLDSRIETKPEKRRVQKAKKSKLSFEHDG